MGRFPYKSYFDTQIYQCLYPCYLHAMRRDRDVVTFSLFIY